MLLVTIFILFIGKVYKLCFNYVESMINDTNYSCRLPCSKKTKRYIDNECKEDFLKEYPEYEGKNITINQVLVHLIKSKLNLFYLENDKHNSNQSSK